MVIPQRHPARRRPPGGAAVLVALALVAAALAGCAEERDDASLTRGLLILSGDVGDVSLTVREGPATRGRAIALPDPATSWVSAGRTNVLLATLVDGRTFVSSSLGADEPAWRLVESVTIDDVPPEPPLYYGAWDPPGGAYAQLGADFAAGTDLRVVVTDPALEGSTVAPLEGARPVPAPPAWIDDDRVVVVTATIDTNGTVIVDTTSGDATAGPPGPRLVATSADATRVAVWHGGRSPIEVLATDAWLDGQTASIRIDPPEVGWAPAVLALDGPGDRLAVAWTDEGAPAGVTVYAAVREWAAIASLDLADVEAASVAWLR